MLSIGTVLDAVNLLTRKRKDNGWNDEQMQASVDKAEEQLQASEYYFSIVWNKGLQEYTISPV